MPITVDVSTLSGWSELSSGTYAITIKAKRSGDINSNASSSVNVVKPALGYTVEINMGGAGGQFELESANDHTTSWEGEGVYNNVYSINDYSYDGSDGYYSIDGNYMPALPYVLTKNVTTHIYSTPQGGCFLKGTKIALANGRSKNIENIKADDLITTWDFDNGVTASANPAVLYYLGKTHYYEILTFSDGSQCKTVLHRLFNVEEGKFVYSNEIDFLVGSQTLNKNGNIVTLVSREKVFDKDGIDYYNMRTKYYINYYIDGILSGTRLANIYPIVDKKYVKDDREIIPYELFPRLTREQYDDCRVGEQPFINRDGDVDMGDKDIQDYLLRWQDKNILK